MQGLRWLGPPTGADEHEPGSAPPVGSFDRRADGTVAIRTTPTPTMPPRIVGTDPEALLAHPSRERNRAHGGVYTLHRGAERVGSGTRTAAARLLVPVVGEIAAGNYQVSVAYYDYRDCEQGVDVERALVQAGSGAYALRVRGTSMTHVGIEPGDLVVVRPQDSADNGDFVVAHLVDSTDPAGYVTLKRFYRRADHIFLQSATADKDPIRLFPQANKPGRADRDQVKVQGKVVVVIKGQH